MIFTRGAVAISAAAVFATLPASNAAAQTEAQVRDAFVKFTAAQRSLGMNESCAVLDQAETRYADAMIGELKSPLARILGDQFKPEEIWEEGRVLFEGCKSRDEASDAWKQIDFVKQMSAASVIAASLIPMSPDDCIGKSNSPVSAGQLKIAADRVKASLQSSQQEPVLAAAKSMVPLFEQGCAEKKDYYYPSTFGPALAKVAALRQLRSTPAGTSDAGLAGIGEPEKSAIDPWIGPWESYFLNYRMGDYASVTAYRTLSSGKAVAKFRVSAGGAFSGSGNVYFTRDGKIEASFDKDYDSIVLKSVEGDRSYVLLRTNPSVSPDFFGNNRAEFAMNSETLKRFISENDEDADFYIQYRPELKGELRRFLNSASKNSVKVNMGDLVRASRWAMAPSPD
ncbi:hypothetical protein [Pontixanthobacter aquaemixtae]|uniref:Uncharacterized protein n=1 Tax=Pontixanthobacter aquaemixtae TaxID=1958940 RepID=A0A844ZVB5_9SPHN|nr:hypothetical protein [Pontixanthobacter aquaemixtae]MXO91973.1 hypothetical protein [Pontixanthobacter aquaemixtae]